MEKILCISQRKTGLGILLAANVNLSSKKIPQGAKSHSLWNCVTRFLLPDT